MKIPYFAQFTAQKVASDPQEAFSSLECFLGSIFKTSYLIRTLLELILPYGYGLLLFIFWLVKTRTSDKAVSKLLG